MGGFARFTLVRLNLISLDERLVLDPQLAKLLPPALSGC